jgi:hypothetical protein
MPWRPVNAVDLALSFQPIFFFDPSERFYPIAAEEWLNHMATEQWSASITHQRGSVVLRVDDTATSFGSSDVRAGSDYPSGDHIQLSDNHPNGIGSIASAGPRRDLFLDVAGRKRRRNSSVFEFHKSRDDLRILWMYGRIS